MIGASPEVDNQPADDLLWMRFVKMAMTYRIKIHTKPITSITAKLQCAEIKQRATLTFQGSKESFSYIQHSVSLLKNALLVNSLWPKDLIQEMM